MRRLLRAVMATIAATAVAAPSASASAPMREPTPVTPDLSISGICSFTVDAHVVVNKQVITTFSSGKVLAAGRLVFRLTNAETGKSIVVNASGPGFIYPQADGTLLEVGTGRGIVIFTARESGVGHPIFLLTYGRFEVTFGRTGAHVLSLPHHTTNVCALLS